MPRLNCGLTYKEKSDLALTSIFSLYLNLLFPLSAVTLLQS